VAGLRSVVAAFALLFAGAAAAVADEAGWAALARPGTAALMRHAEAPGIGDPPAFRLGDCATQRNLSEDGRRQARAIGAALRSRGIIFDRVLSSAWCRCAETAELLALGPVEPLPALNSLFRNADRAEAQTSELRTFLAERAGGEKLMLVTHQRNIAALTGAGAASGEIVVVAIGAGGKVVVRGRIEAPRP